MFGNKLRTRLTAWIGLVMLLFGLTASAGYDGLNMPVGVTPISKTAYDVHMLMLYVCIVIGIIVFGIMIYSIIYHRKAAGHEAAQFHHSTFAEIVWTVIPFVILVVFAVPATKGLIVMEDTSESDVTVKITGYQWLWKYEYLEDGVTVFSSLAPSSRAVIYSDPNKVENYLLEVDNEIVFPVGKKVRVLLTAADVIHAWWVPALGMKKDAIPGYINEMWFRVQEAGTYRGQCTELCGKDHGFMPIVVVAKNDAGYKEWVAQKKTDAAESAIAAAKKWDIQDLIAKGEAVYNSSCASCHMVDGNGLDGSFPAIKGSEVATGPIENHLNLVVNGKPGTAMSAFGGQLDDVDLAAVITYQRNAFGNEAGDLVQPSTVSAARNL